MTSARVFSGYVVANRLHIGPPSETPSSAASRDPAAAMTARTSSMRCSSVGSATDAIGQPRAALVEQDHSRELRETAQEPGEARLGPEALEVRHPPHDEHEVDRSLAEHLIGDVHVAAACVVGRGRFGAGDALCGMFGAVGDRGV